MHHHPNGNLRATAVIKPALQYHCLPLTLHYEHSSLQNNPHTTLRLTHHLYHLSQPKHKSATMFGFGDAQDNYDKVYKDDNKAELSHELLAGGASFMAMKMFEDRQRKEGKKSASSHFIA
jgi:hypothetical protein